jgi:cytochrome c553
MPTPLRCAAARAALLMPVMLALVACGDVPTPAAGPEAGPPAQIGLCVACHTDDGRGGPAGTPRIAGQDEAYLRASLLAYRQGERRHPGMRAIAGALSPAEIDAFAAWYAAQPACPPDA